jgi:hypothetical protein
MLKSRLKRVAVTANATARSVNLIDVICEAALCSWRQTRFRIQRVTDHEQEIEPNRNWGGIALMAAFAAPIALAADQVLSCTPQAAQGPDTQVLISEGFFGKGRILWPSPAGTVVYNILEKTSVSYSAEQVASSDATAPSGKLYINRLNGELNFELPVSPRVADTLAAVCKGNLTREECSQTLRQSNSSPSSFCFAYVDCSKLGGGAVSGVVASYKCKRSYKKF